MADLTKYSKGKRMVSEDQIKKLENLADIREAGDGITIEDGVISAEGATYTAGDNITIEDGVISATDTTYTAGTGIDITDGVISATGGSTTKYNHCLIFNAKTGSNYGAYMSVNIEKNNNTPITLKDFLDLLYNNNNIQFTVVGGIKDSSNFMIIKSISYIASQSQFYTWVIKDNGSLDTVQLSITRNQDGTYTGTDLQLIDQVLEITL